MDASKTRNVGIVLYQHVEILDFAGPYEVLYAARTGDRQAFHVFTVAAESDIITCSGGLMVQPHHTIDDHPPIDIVVIPGGGFNQEEPANRRLVEWVGERNGTAEIMASVCTGSFLLGKVGALRGLRATSHWGAIDFLRREFPDVDFVDNERVVDTGRIVTAAGVSAGIDMALHLVERLLGPEEARRVARYMEYDWRAPAVAAS